MTLEVLLASWYVGVLAIVGGMAAPLGPLRPWALRVGTAVMVASGAVLVYEFVRLP